LWCGGGNLHRECPEKTNAESTSSCCNYTLAEGEKPHPARTEDAATRKEKCKGEEHSELAGDSLGGFSSLSSPHQSNPKQVHCVKTINTRNQRHRRQRRKASGTPCSSICHNRNFRNLVSQYMLLVGLSITL
jgi:hypothetical protein